MGANYYVAVRPRINENHAVHKEGCPFLTNDEKRIYLGAFKSDQDAMSEGHRHFAMTKGCLFCCKEKESGDRTTSQSIWYGKGIIPVRLHIQKSYHQSLFCCLN